MLRYLNGWKATPKWNIPNNFSPQTKVSILIPARNEAENILSCIQSILKQNYPSHLFEIILIDDHSDDGTAKIIQQLNQPNIQILALKDFVKNREALTSFKKKAIEIAIKHSNGELIITTDADCIVPKNWLNHIVSLYEKEQPKFIAAPVNFYNEKSLFEKFQSLDFIGMMGVTGAGITKQFMSMCNGANLAYEKKVFNEVNGFRGIDHLASGDDMLLMQKIAERYPNRIRFLKNKNATVLSLPQPTLKSFANQRIRWASKSSSYPEFQITIMLALVFFFCVNILLSILLIPFFGKKMLWIFLFQFFTKIIIDFFFLKKMSDFFGRKDLMRIFFPAQIMHILYIGSIGFVANLKKEYNWKGRKVR